MGKKIDEFCESHLLLIDWSKNSDEVITSMSQAMRMKFDKY